MRTALRIVTAAAVACAVGFSIGGTSHAATDFRGLAHQGAHDGEPGDFDHLLDNNTLRAFTVATRHGLFNETDLRINSEGRFFMVHEAELSSNAVDCDGLVSERTTSYIRGCHTKHGYELPTLRQTVRRMVRENGRITIDVKPDSRLNADPDEWVGRMVRVIRSNGGASNVWLEAIDTDILRSFQRVAPRIKVLWKARTVEEATGESAQELGVDAVILQSDAPRSKVRNMHAHGVKVFSERTEDRATWSRLDEAGWDGTLTDEAAEFVAWRRNQ